MPSLVEIGSVVLENITLQFNLLNVFLQYCYYLPLEKGVVLQLNKLKVPSPKEALCKVWLKLAQWLFRKRF